jgi:hypothetical protein
MPFLLLNQCDGGNNQGKQKEFSLGNCDIIIQNSASLITNNIDVLLNNEPITPSDYNISCTISEYSEGLMHSSINITNNTSIKFDPGYYNMSSLPSFGSSFSFKVDATIVDVHNNDVYLASNVGYIYASSDAALHGTANGSNWYGMISGSVTVEFNNSTNPTSCYITSSQSYVASNLSIPSSI